MQATQNIAIVGAGIMGRMLAWQLLQTAQQQQRLLRLSIYDKDPIGSGSAAAYTAAGMLTPYCELESAENLIFDMGMASLSQWPSIAQSLPLDIHLKQGGSLIISHPNDTADYQRFLQQLTHKISPDNHHIQQLSNRELSQYSSQLATNFNTAIHLPQECWLDSQRCMQALADYSCQHGVNWHENTHVSHICAGDNGVEITVNQQTTHYDHVIDCRGLAAKPDIKQLRGVRGELIWLHAPEVHIKHLVRLMHPRYRIYLVPRENDIYLLGATQIESEDNEAITVRSALELLTAAYSLHSGFAEARVVKTATNCRPALRDNLPSIEVDNHLMRINGLFRHGYLLAPVLANIATHQLLQTGQTTPFDAAIIHSTATQIL